MLKKVAESLTRSIQLAETDANNESQLATYLIERSATYLETANFVGGPARQEPSALKAQQVKLLAQAQADATRAAGMETVYRDYAYRSLGNALEDLA